MHPWQLCTPCGAQSVVCHQVLSFKCLQLCLALCYSIIICYLGIQGDWVAVSMHGCSFMVKCGNTYKNEKKKLDSPLGKLVRFSTHGYPFHNTVHQTVKHRTSPTGPGLVSTSPLSSSKRTTTSPTALLPILEAKLGRRQGEAQHMHTPTTGVWPGGTWSRW